MLKVGEGLSGANQSQRHVLLCTLSKMAAPHFNTFLEGLAMNVPQNGGNGREGCITGPYQSEFFG